MCNDKRELLLSYTRIALRRTGIYRCYTDYGEDNAFTYGQVAEEIAKLHLLFQHCSLRRGDKISIIGKNTSRWCIAYMATITYGAIVVPILQDFKPNDVHHIVNHSESTFLFVSDNIWENLEEEALGNLRAVFSLTDYRCLHQRDGETIQKFMRNIDTAMKKAIPKVSKRRTSSIPNCLMIK